MSSTLHSLFAWTGGGDVRLERRGRVGEAHLRRRVLRTGRAVQRRARVDVGAEAAARPAARADLLPQNRGALQSRTTGRAGQRAILLSVVPCFRKPCIQTEMYLEGQCSEFCQAVVLKDDDTFPKEEIELWGSRLVQMHSTLNDWTHAFSARVWKERVQQ